jgi:hypothetical protein
MVSHNPAKSYRDTFLLRALFLPLRYVIPSFLLLWQKGFFMFIHLKKQYKKLQIKFNCESFVKFSQTRQKVSCLGCKIVSQHVERRIFEYEC